MQCISFFVPGFILAFLLHFQILKVVNLSVKNYIHSDLNLGFSSSGFIISFIIIFYLLLLQQFYLLKVF